MLKYFPLLGRNPKLICPYLFTSFLAGRIIERVDSWILLLRISSRNLVSIQTFFCFKWATKKIFSIQLDVYELKSALSGLQCTVWPNFYPFFSISSQSFILSFQPHFKHILVIFFVLFRSGLEPIYVLRMQINSFRSLLHSVTNIFFRYLWLIIEGCKVFFYWISFYIPLSIFQDVLILIIF